MNTLPEHILEWIEHVPYEMLLPDQQEAVTAYLSKAEYDELHRAAQFMRRETPLFKTAPANHKQSLLAAFDQHYRKPVPIWQQPIQFWKVAAVLLLLGSGWLLHWNSYKQTVPVTASLVDTVYLTEEVPVKVYDTVFVESPAGVSASTDHSTADHRSDASMVYRHSRRGIPLKDDTLVQRFQFVSL